MKLFLSHTSPFARKVTLFLHFSGLIKECEQVLTSFESEELRKQNPLGKIPAFQDGELTLFESALICEYLDDKYVAAGNSSLFGKGSALYYTRQLSHARADGVTGAAVSTVMELRRTTEHSRYWIERWHSAIKEGLLTMKLDELGSPAAPHIGTFATLACCGYLDFRLNNYQWRDIRPDLAEWYLGFAELDWFVNTAPPAGA